jgi:NADH/F420H2 dehydrogenase subunit C
MDSGALTQAVIDLAPGAQRREQADRPAVRVAVEQLSSLFRRLRQDERLAFDMLLDVTAVDWLSEGRFELLYNFFSTVHGHYLLVSAVVPRETPVVPTASGVWQAAEWQEREVFDLFGILFDDHPDLRRVFLEDNWQGYPLRKDYQDEQMLEWPK